MNPYWSNLFVEVARFGINDGESDNIAAGSGIIGDRDNNSVDGESGALEHDASSVGVGDGGGETLPTSDP